MTPTRLTTAPDSTSGLLDRRALLRAITGATALGAFPALLGCASIPTKKGNRAGNAGSPSDPVTAAPGTVVMVIRHAEKPTKSGAGSTGTSLTGATDVHSLTERGWTRAADLVALFTQGGGRVALPVPNVIYASGLGAGDGEGTRPRQTVGPLAAQLGIPVDTTFSRGQEAALARQAATQAGPTLICWQHESIPAIGAAFAPDTPAPPTVWPDDRFDVVWVFTATDSGWRFEQVPERLLPDDGDSGFS
jgi:hypothetical protein